MKTNAISIREEITLIIRGIDPLDSVEKTHIEETIAWIESGDEIFRLQKPATPLKHLVAYFLLLDVKKQKILLIDHIKSGLWLPNGGHVDPHEHPTDTVVREAREELGIEAIFYKQSPLFLTVTNTVGTVEKHTDVSLWYVLKANTEDSLNLDCEEFTQASWFEMNAIDFSKSDRHLERFLKKINTDVTLNRLYHSL